MKLFIFAPLLLLTLVPAPHRDLCGIAYKRLAEIHTDWSHNGFGTTDFKSYCPSCRWVGENLARGQSDAAEANRQWRLSPSHKANLDHPRLDSCLVSDTYDGKKYYVEIYAK